MRIHLVNHEAGATHPGILTKYADRMLEDLKALGVDVTMSGKPDPVDVNHHINYWGYEPGCRKTKNTLMVTHIFDGHKLDRIRRAMDSADCGICFSGQTQEILEAKGIKRLTTILPAHDGHARKPLKVLVNTNVYPDGCKREWMFSELVNSLPEGAVQFHVMGLRWEPELEKIRKGKAASVFYHGPFEYLRHLELLEICDYALYFGKDEGSMGMLDARQLGLKIIAPLAGFHVEMGVDHPFDSQEELNGIFHRLTTSPVSEWTWKRYAGAHLDIWKGLL